MSYLLLKVTNRTKVELVASFEDERRALAAWQGVDDVRYACKISPAECYYSVRADNDEHSPLVRLYNVQKLASETLTPIGISVNFDLTYVD